MADDQVDVAGVQALSRLLRVSQLLRAARTRDDVSFCAVNDLHRLVSYDRAFLFCTAVNKLVRASGEGALDFSRPGMIWLARLAVWWAHSETCNDDIVSLSELDLPDHLLQGAENLNSDLILLPCRDGSGALVSVVLLSRASKFRLEERRVFLNICPVIGTAMGMFDAPGRRRMIPLAPLALSVFLVAAFSAALPVAVPISGAGVVQPGKPIRLAAPFDGVITRVATRNLDDVKAGQILFEMEGREIEAGVRVAKAGEAVGLVGARRSEIRGFAQQTARSLILLERLELAERAANRNRIDWRLRETDVRAPVDGQILLKNVELLRGRAVKTGEPVLWIAGAGSVEVAFDVPLGDALLVQPGNRLRFFRSGRLSTPYLATILRVGHEAIAGRSGEAIVRGEARLELPIDTPILKSGMVGHVVISGVERSLLYVVARKPWTWFRRVTGF